MKRLYTDKQGQYLAFIYYYGKIHGSPQALMESRGRAPGYGHALLLCFTLH
jgi:hypothetical protein